MQRFFRGSNLKADIIAYADIIEYIHSIHPDFVTYTKQQVYNNLEETFVFLDKDLRELTQEEMFMRKAKEGDTIHIVPCIVGGGGKRGALALLAVAAMVFFAPTLLAASGAFGAGATAAGIGSTAILGTTVGTLSSTIGLNLALMAISMLFTSKKSAAETSRDNDAFGSLVNTTASGTPIALHYGLVRVGGQLISGYTKTVEVPQGQQITMNDIISV